MKTHIKILGAIYIGVSILIGLLILLMVSYLVFADKGNKSGSDVVSAITALILLLFWFWSTGTGLWNLKSGAWLLALITGGILMLVLNSLFLFADGGKFAVSAGQKIFHIFCIAVGIDTVIIMILPSGRAAFEQQKV